MDRIAEPDKALGLDFRIPSILLILFILSKINRQLSRFELVEVERIL